MLSLLFHGMLFATRNLLSPEIMSVIEVHILWTLFTHPSGVGTDDGELEELENFERENVQSSDQEIGINSLLIRSRLLREV